MSLSSYTIDGALLRRRGKDMTIIICYNKPSDRKWDWTAVGVNRVGGWRRTWKRWSRKFEDFSKTGRCWSAQLGFSDLINLGLDSQRWVEILDPARCTVREVAVSVVWLAVRTLVTLLRSLLNKYYREIYTSPAFWLGRLAFVSDGISKPMADSRPKGPQLRLGHPRVGDLLFCPPCIALDLTV